MRTDERLLQAAERRLRLGGYNGFSFRDLARDVGLTNAGVHHHFPSKADLVARLTDVYADRFVSALDGAAAQDRPRRLRALFSDSLRAEGRMCLCGLLAAESGALPEPVVAATRRFFRELTESLTPAFSDRAHPSQAALALLARLEGALLLAVVMRDPELFDAATADLIGV